LPTIGNNRCRAVLGFYLVFSLSKYSLLRDIRHSGATFPCCKFFTLEEEKFFVLVGRCVVMHSYCNAALFFVLTSSRRPPCLLMQNWFFSQTLDRVLFFRWLAAPFSPLRDRNFLMPPSVHLFFPSTRTGPFPSPSPPVRGSSVAFLPPVSFFSWSRPFSSKNRVYCYSYDDPDPFFFSEVSKGKGFIPDIMGTISLPWSHLP